jgi:hypothetical protein
LYAAHSSLHEQLEDHQLLHRELLEVLEPQSALRLVLEIAQRVLVCASFT